MIIGYFKSLNFSKDFCCFNEIKHPFDSLDLFIGISRSQDLICVVTVHGVRHAAKLSK